MLEDGLEDVDKLIDLEKKNSKKLWKEADVESDTVGANYLKVVNSVSFADLSIYTVELQVSEHWRPEVVEKVNDEGQDTISSRWVVTAKEKHDGQKQKTKARLVARGFQVTIKLQWDSTTVSKQSFKLLMTIPSLNWACIPFTNIFRKIVRHSQSSLD